MNRSILAVLLATAAVLPGCGNEAAAKAPQPVAKSDAEIAAMVEKGMMDIDLKMSKEWILRQAKDPDSVQFRDVRYSRKQQDLPAVCGEFNGKNSYGAYAGFTRFVYSSGGRIALTDGEDLFLPMWEKLC